MKIKMPDQTNHNLLTDVRTDNGCTHALVRWFVHTRIWYARKQTIKQKPKKANAEGEQQFWADLHSNIGDEWERIALGVEPQSLVFVQSHSVCTPHLITEARAHCTPTSAFQVDLNELRYLFRVHLINYVHWVQRLCVGHETMIINCEISDTARRKWAIFQLTAFVECYWKSIDVFSTLRTVIPIFTRLLRRFYGSEKKWIHLLAIFEKKLVKCRKRPVELFWFFVHIKTYENARGFQLSPYSSVTCFGRRIRIADHIVATIWKSNDHPIHFCLAMNFLWSWATWTERMLLPSRIYECKIQLLVVFFSNRLTIYSNFRLHHD